MHPIYLIKINCKIKYGRTHQNRTLPGITKGNTPEIQMKYAKPFDRSRKYEILDFEIEKKVGQTCVISN